MNELKVYQQNELSRLKDIDVENKGKYTGFFYVLEWNEITKIGCTKSPYQRYMALKRNAEKYGSSKIGRIAISVAHTNYRSNEKLIHEAFSSSRKDNTELFDIPFDEAIQLIPKNITYIDDSKEIDRKSDIFFKAMKCFTLGGKIWTN